MTKGQSLALVVGAAILALVGFQNCSKVGVSDSASTMNNKVAGNPAVSEDPPILATSDTSVPHMEVGDDDKDPKKDPPKKDDDKKDVVKKEEDEGEELADISESDAVALCLDGKASGKLSLVKKFSKSLSGPEVVKVRGATFIESDELTNVEDIRGLLVIRGKTAAAHAKQIRNTRGAMVLCGISADLIDDSRGVIVLVNSNVKSINNHRGAIAAMNSKVDSTSDIRGVIKEIKK